MRPVKCIYYSDSYDKKYDYRGYKGNELFIRLYQLYPDFEGQNAPGNADHARRLADFQAYWLSGLKTGADFENIRQRSGFFGRYARGQHFLTGFKQLYDLFNIFNNPYISAPNAPKTHSVEILRIMAFPKRNCTLNFPQRDHSFYWAYIYPSHV